MRAIIAVNSEGKELYRAVIPMWVSSKELLIDRRIVYVSVFKEETKSNWILPFKKTKKVLVSFTRKIKS